jgi:hypothetical protein
MLAPEWWWRLVGVKHVGVDHFFPPPHALICRCAAPLQRHVCPPGRCRCLLPSAVEDDASRLPKGVSCGWVGRGLKERRVGRVAAPLAGATNHVPQLYAEELEASGSVLVQQRLEAAAVRVRGVEELRRSCTCRSSSSAMISAAVSSDASSSTSFQSFRRPLLSPNLSSARSPVSPSLPRGGRSVCETSVPVGDRVRSAR